MCRTAVLVERDAQALIPLLPQIQSLADSEKDTALGFLPAKAFADAIGRGRLISAIVEEHDRRSFAGYILHSGVFPNAKIQQIAVEPAFRRLGVASCLLNALISDLEQEGYLSIRADVASDLKTAIKFYTQNGFDPVFKRSGGKARGREIIVHSRQLDTDSLFSLCERTVPQPDFALRRRLATETPVFALDLNVYFDLVRNREQSEFARKLFGQALGHTIRLAVADEFVSELTRTSSSPAADPVLQMAQRLPRLPRPDPDELERATNQIYDVVFVNRSAKGTGSSQAKSDARHLAHAAISRASAFITRDGSILRARQELLSAFGIDVATIEEVLDLLPEPFLPPRASLNGRGFERFLIKSAELSAYLREAKVPAHVAQEFTDPALPTECVEREAVRCDGRILAVGAVHVRKGVDPIARMIIHVRHDHAGAEFFADYLVNALINSASRSAPVAIELIRLDGQSVVNKLAALRGFQRPPTSSVFSKIAVGRPCSLSTWPAIARQVRRRTGLVLPESLPVTSGHDPINIQTPKGIKAHISASILEDFLSPTLVVWPGREGVIVPITKQYADELLGTSTQPSLAFIANRDAAFLSVRGYINTPRAARKMRAGSPIIFYESKSKGGQGAAVAVARIVNSVVVPKSELKAKTDNRLVVDNPDVFSLGDSVLLTTFDNLMAFPIPLPFKALKALDAVGKTNLVTATTLTSAQLDSILAYGWPGGRF